MNPALDTCLRSATDVPAHQRGRRVAALLAQRRRARGDAEGALRAFGTAGRY